MRLKLLLTVITLKSWAMSDLARDGKWANARLITHTASRVTLPRLARNLTPGTWMRFSARLMLRTICSSDSSGGRKLHLMRTVTNHWSERARTATRRRARLTPISKCSLQPDHTIRVTKPLRQKSALCSIDLVCDPTPKVVLGVGRVKLRLL